MFVLRCTLIAVAWLPAGFAAADPAASLAGHWEGAIETPTEQIAVAVDLAAAEGGKLGGTFSTPSEKLSGFPLRGASLDGETVKIEIKTADPGLRSLPLALTLENHADRTATGTWSAGEGLNEGGAARPVVFTRAGGG